MYPNLRRFLSRKFLLILKIRLNLRRSEKKRLATRLISPSFFRLKAKKKSTQKQVKRSACPNLRRFLSRKSIWKWRIWMKTRKL